MFFQELSEKLGKRQGGWNSSWFIELEGGKLIMPTAFEPDPNTHRDDYYYNAVTNTLYKKVVSRKENGITVTTWQKTSQ